MFKRFNIVVFATFLSTGAVGYSTQPAGARSNLLQKLFDCRSVTEIGSRAACYDAQVDALSAVERDRRDPVPGETHVHSPEKNESAEEVSRIETTIVSVARLNNSFLLTLEGGARWVQSDSEALSSDPRPGEAIVIRKAAMGSYIANVGKRPAIRVRRIR